MDRFASRRRFMKQVLIAVGGGVGAAVTGLNPFGISPAFAGACGCDTSLLQSCGWGSEGQCDFDSDGASDGELCIVKCKSPNGHWECANSVVAPKDGTLCDCIACNNGEGQCTWAS